MRVGYVGNFAVSYSTESHIARAWENNGHTVTRIPEQNLEWRELPKTLKYHDLFLWTRTAGFDPPDRLAQLAALSDITIPKVGYHLDRWWGLSREWWVHDSPFFTATDFLCTADGGHDAQWAAAGITHHWFPPAILSDEAKPGRHYPEFSCEVAFVGNLDDYGHPEWAPYRRSLAAHLRNRYGRRFRVFPGRGPVIRGADLANLYATVPVLVGDSCLAGGAVKYWSDRVPETLGRGGFLIHPAVDGLEEAHPYLATYPLGDFEFLCQQIDWALSDTNGYSEYVHVNYEHTIAHHTYEHRMRRLESLI